MLRFVKENSGTAIIFVLFAIPLLIWVSIQPPSSRFLSLSLVLTSIGQLSGLIGMVLFALVLVLETRAKFIDNIFYGINRAYTLHHNLGAVAFLLLLMHPAALALKFLLISAGAAFNLIITSDWVLMAGEAALLLMMLLLILTFFVKLKYQVWKFSHKFLGLAFVIASLHVFFISSDISRSASLMAYMAVLILAGYWAILYRTVFPRFFVKKYNYVVDSIKQYSDSIIEISMALRGNKMEFKPGQFIFISFEDEAIGKEIHPFSLTSAPAEEKLRITAKESGDFTARLKILKSGTKVKIEGAFGRFSYLNFSPKHKQIWIAGGIGVSPFLSMARSLIPESNYEIDLYYCVNGRTELIFYDELKMISAKSGKFKILPFCSDENGRISGEFISKASEGSVGKEIFICGPSGMMAALRNQFVKLGVKNYNIHTEEFKMY